MIIAVIALFYDCSEFGFISQELFDHFITNLFLGFFISGFFFINFTD